MKYETGEVEPPVEVIRKLKEIYNVPYEVLIDNRVDLISAPKTVSYETSSKPFLDDYEKTLRKILDFPFAHHQPNDENLRQKWAGG